MSLAKPFVIALFVSIVGGSLAMAQGNAVTVPINNWSYYRHASTFEEGALRGTAAVVTAAGQKNYLDSVAAVNVQEALRRRIENGGLYVKTYLENRELNRQYREKYRAVPPTREQWERVTEASLPDRLTADQYDPATGALVWPHILRTDEYKAFRDRIDELMASRTPENSGDGSPSQRELDELIDGMKMLLKSNIDQVSPAQYAAAKWFLLSLDYEVLFPLTGNAPATAVDADEKPENDVSS